MNQSLHVIVVRHAIAEDRDARLWPDDAQRPLSRRGVRRFRRALPGITCLAKLPAEVWTSPLRRARQTARLAEKRVDWPAGKLIEALKPGRSPADLGRALEAFRVARRAAPRVAVVGHEPGLSRFLAWGLGNVSPRGLGLRKGGAALVVFESAVRSGGGRLEWLVTPRALRRLARNLPRP
jgi:phosphohistidine phosphatase